MFAAIVTTRATLSGVTHFALNSFSQYPVRIGELPRVLIAFLLMNLLGLLSTVAIVVGRKLLSKAASMVRQLSEAAGQSLGIGNWLGQKEDVELDRWLVASGIVFGVVGVLAMAKQGGGSNSLMPACLCFSMLAARHARRLPVGVIVGLLVIQTAAVPKLMAFATTHAGHGDARYADVIALAKSLPGVVRCPEDPTIPLFARGEATRCLDFELDATGQREVPPAMRQEIASADWVVHVSRTWDAHGFAATLASLGFERVDEPRLNGSVYSLWRKRS